MSRWMIPNHFHCRDSMFRFESFSSVEAGGFLSHRGTPKSSSISDWDFHEINNPARGNTIYIYNIIYSSMYPLVYPCDWIPFPGPSGAQLGLALAVRPRRLEETVSDIR